MGHAQLQSRFEEQVARFERVRGFIERCHEMSGRFSPAVVAKVVADYETQSLEIVGAIMLLQPDVEGAVAELRGQRDQIERGVEHSRLALEELELRLAIGQIEQAEFDTESQRYKAELDAVEEQFLAIDQDVDAYEALLRRWSDAGQAAGVLKAA